MPKSAQRCVTNLSSSTNEPSSRSASMRSRAVSLPASCCFAMRALPPASAAFASMDSRRAMGSCLLTCAAYSSGVSNVKGSALASRVLWVQLGHGEAGMQRLLAQCTPDLKYSIERGIEKAKWYPFEQFVELNEVIDRLFGKGDLGLVQDLGRFGADA